MSEPPISGPQCEIAALDSAVGAATCTHQSCYDIRLSRPVGALAAMMHAAGFAGLRWADQWRPIFAQLAKVRPEVRNGS